MYSIKTLLLLFFGPSLSYIQASIASFLMWGSSSWIRGSDSAIWTFVPGNRDGVPLQVLWLRILCLRPLGHHSRFLLLLKRSNFFCRSSSSICGIHFYSRKQTFRSGWTSTFRKSKSYFIMIGYLCHARFRLRMRNSFIALCVSHNFQWTYLKLKFYTKVLLHVWDVWN